MAPSDGDPGALPALLPGRLPGGDHDAVGSARANFGGGNRVPSSPRTPLNAGRSDGNRVGDRLGDCGVLGLEKLWTGDELRDGASDNCCCLAGLESLEAGRGRKDGEREYSCSIRS